MKILILIIYSTNVTNGVEDVYEKMARIQKSYIHNFPENVTSYFVQMRENQLELVEIENDHIYVKGAETLLNIMYKTVEAMDYLLGQGVARDIDFILRTNISTIVNIPKLLDFFQELPKENVYTGGSLLNLNWLDYNSGIRDSTFFGTEYAQGTCIILSKDVAQHITNNKANVRYDVVDDVSFGVYMKNFLPEAHKDLEKYKMSNYAEVGTLYVNTEPDKNTIIFRNRIHCWNRMYNRYNDVYNMQKICESLYTPN